MFFIYDDRSKGGGFNPMDLNPNKMYKKHIENWFYLSFIATTSDIFSERNQARKELDICERKQAYWKKHPEFDPEIATHDTENVRKSWKMDKNSIDN